MTWEAKELKRRHDGELEFYNREQLREAEIHLEELNVREELAAGPSGRSNLTDQQKQESRENYRELTDKLKQKFTDTNRRLREEFTNTNKELEELRRLLQWTATGREPDAPLGYSPASP